MQAAINAATPDLPSDLPTRPFFRKFNPGGGADHDDRADLRHAVRRRRSTTSPTASSRSGCRRWTGVAQVNGERRREAGGARAARSRPRWRPRDCPARTSSPPSAPPTSPARSAASRGPTAPRPSPPTARSSTAPRLRAAGDEERATAPSCALPMSPSVIDGVANVRLAAWFGKQPAILLTVTKSVGANVIETVDRVRAVLPLLQSLDAAGHQADDPVPTAPAPSAPASTTCRSRC